MPVSSIRARLFKGARNGLSLQLQSIALSLHRFIARRCVVPSYDRTIVRWCWCPVELCAFSGRRTTCNEQRAAFNVQRAERSVQYAPPITINHHARAHRAPWQSLCHPCVAKLQPCVSSSARCCHHHRIAIAVLYVVM